MLWQFDKRLVPLQRQLCQMQFDLWRSWHVNEQFNCDKIKNYFKNYESPLRNAQLVQKNGVLAVGWALLRPCNIRLYPLAFLQELKILRDGKEARRR